MCIAPYESMKDLFISLAASRQDVDITVFSGDREAGVEQVRSHINPRVDAIISRGVTADLIHSNFSVPVYKIGFSTYDILRAIKTAMSLEKRFAIVGLPEVVMPSRQLCDVLQLLDVAIIPIASIEQTSAALNNVKKKGYPLVVGDMNTISFAQRVALKGILIVSGIESVRDTIDIAAREIRKIRTYKMQIALGKKVLGSISEKVAIYSKDKQLVYSSLPNNDMASLEQKLLYRLDRIDDNQFSSFIVYNCQYEYRIFGKCLTEDETEKHYLFEVMARSRKNRKPAYKCYNYDELDTPRHNLGNISSEGSAFHNKLNHYYSTPSSFLIMGEVGTNVDGIAIQLYRLSQWSSGVFIILDCSIITKDEWDSFIDDVDSPLYETDTTIHIKNIDKLEHSLLSAFLWTLSRSNYKQRIRLILSCHLSESMTYDALMKKYPFLLSDFVSLRIPSLREHPEDIWELANFYINELASVYSKNTIGLMPEANEVLTSYEWPLNNLQLRRILEYTIKQSDNYYITTSDIERSMKQEMSIANIAKDKKLSIDINKPLKDIENDIVDIVLKQENYNQSKAAKRLGISRSTIYRILDAEKNR